MACKGIDEQVVRQDSELQKLQEKFVCVRLVQMKGADLQLFQFDYDQTWAVVFLNADGAIYGRYGTRAGGKARSTTHISVAGFKKAMQRALDLHAAYPANKKYLAGKRGPKPRFRVAEDIPTLRDQARGETTQKNCIHCHMVSAHLRKLKYGERKLRPEDLWVYPLPENVGLEMKVDDCLVVEAVTPESPAARAGIEPDDELVSMEKQPLVSQADIQWVLHEARPRDRIAVTLRRAGRTLEKSLRVDGDWKRTDLVWRETSWSLRPGIWTVPLSPEARKERGIPGERLALRVKWVFPRARLARRAGLQDGDLIVAVDGKRAPMDESEFMTYVRLAHPPGDKVKLTLLRDGKEQEVHLEVE